MDDLTQKTNEELFALYKKERNPEIRRELTMRYLYIATSVARQMYDIYSSAMQMEDAVNEGVLAIMRGIDSYDPDKNVKFSTYAVPMIIGEIRRYLRDNNAIRVSRSLRDIAYKALLVRDRLVKDNNQEPTMSQIAKELNIPREEVVFALDAIQDPVSLFEPIYHDGGDAIYVMDQISDSKNSDDSWLENISIKEAMKKLNNREKLILTLRFFNGRTQMEVADEIGISQAQVSRLEKTALKHMRKYV